MKFPILKTFLTKLGSITTPRVIHNLNGVLNYLSVGRWFKERGIEVPTRISERHALYERVAKVLTEPVTYLEFGVFEGDAMRVWLRLLKHPESRFHGFDSFEGLPENWTMLYGKGAFDLGGKLPDFGDDRLILHKGWFNETVPPFCKTFTAGPQLVIHLDADLYSSTILVLRELKPFLRVGTVLIFDEFFDREHELKALSEFLLDYPMSLDCLGATTGLVQVAFRITKLPDGVSA